MLEGLGSFVHRYNGGGVQSSVWLFFQHPHYTLDHGFLQEPGASGFAAHPWKNNKDTGAGRKFDNLG